METIWKNERGDSSNSRRIETPEAPKPTSIVERLSRLEEEKKYGAMKEDTAKKQKEWKYPFKWKMRVSQSKGKNAGDKVLVWYITKKGEIETPQLLPLYSDHLIIHKNKAYEFDPRAMLYVKAGKKSGRCLIIREIDRRPVSNLDWDEVKKRGDATDSDEIILKMIKKAQIDKIKKQVSKGAIILIVIAIIAAIAFFLFFKK